MKAGTMRRAAERHTPHPGKRRQLRKDQAHHRTIIIGGGVSGLSCARRLKEAGEEFLLITPEIGGRMKTEGGFAYGAGYVTEDYTNVLRYAARDRPKSHGKYHIFSKSSCRSIGALARPRSIREGFILVRFLCLLWQFRRHALKMAAQTAHRPLKDVLASDPLLSRYAAMPAPEFIERYGLEDLNERVLRHVVAATVYTEYSELNAFYYLGICVPAIARTYNIDLAQVIRGMTEGIEADIRIDTVVKVSKLPDGRFSVRARTGRFTSDAVVFAAPQSQLRDVYDLPSPFRQENAYVFKVAGTRRPAFRAENIIFDSAGSDIVSMRHVQGNIDKVVSRSPKPDLRKYYETHTVQEQVSWKPATIIPKEAIPQELGANAFLASDYNVSSLEAAYLTGQYAANRIIARTRRSQA